MRKGMAVGLVAAGLSVGHQVQAQEVLLNGTPVAGSPNVVNQVAVPDQDILTVDPGASIITNLDAVLDLLNGTTITVNNGGTITSTGGRGVNADGSTLFLTNSGTISGTGALGVGVFAATLTNSTNSGTITGGDTGLFASTLTSLSNSGTITGGNFGVNSTTITNLSNSGTITGSNFGVGTGALTNLTNSGTISGGNLGVQTLTITNLTNSGTIIGGVGTAILEILAADTLLTLLPGSNIQGLVDLGGGINTLNVGNGLNMATTFTGAAPVIGTTNGAPFAVNGNQVIVVDPTGFAASGVFLDSITGSIFNSLDGIAGPSNGNGQQATFALLGDGTRAIPAAVVDAAGTGHRLWASSFGGVREQEGSGPTVDLDQVYGGLMFGAEGIQQNDFRGGFFAGGSTSQFDVQFGIQDIEVSSAFGGVYAHRDWASHWIKAVITGGWADHDSTRRVANNLVAGGIETAKASYDGYFVAPAVTFGGRLGETMPGHPMIGSIRVHYAGMFLDGYRETGIANPLTVSGRDIHVAGGRAQLAFPYEQTGADGAAFSFEGRAGLDARFNLSKSRVNATVAGLPLNFNASFDDEVASGFIGASMSRTSADGRGYFRANTEAHIATDGSHELRGQVSAGLTF